MQQDEDALHAGVAAVQVMKGMFMSPCTANRLPEDILALVHVAISKLRVRIAKDECSNDEVTIMVVLFLAHLAVSLFLIKSDCGKSLLTSKDGIQRYGSVSSASESNQVDGLDEGWF